MKNCRAEVDIFYACHHVYVFSIYTLLKRCGEGMKNCRTAVYTAVYTYIVEMPGSLLNNCFSRIM